MARSDGMQAAAPAAPAAPAATTLSAVRLDPPVLLPRPGATQRLGAWLVARDANRGETPVEAGGTSEGGGAAPEEVAAAIAAAGAAWLLPAPVAWGQQHRGGPEEAAEAQPQPEPARIVGADVLRAPSGAGEGGSLIKISLEMEAAAPGMRSLVIFPTAGGCGGGCCCWAADPMPLLVAPSAAAADELLEMFGTMAFIVGKQQRQERQQRLEQGRQWAPAALPARAARAADGDEGQGVADEAAARHAWALHLQPLLFDLQAILACPGAPPAQGAGARAPAPGPGGPLCCVPEGLAAELLCGCLEFFGLHGCWCCASWILAEGSRRGLLSACEPLAARRLDELQQAQAGAAPAGPSAAVAASLLRAFAAAEGQCAVAAGELPGSARHESSEQDCGESDSGSKAAAAVAPRSPPGGRPAAPGGGLLRLAAAGLLAALLVLQLLLSASLRASAMQPAPEAQGGGSGGGAAPRLGEPLAPMACSATLSALLLLFALASGRCCWRPQAQAHAWL